MNSIWGCICRFSLNRDSQPSITFATPGDNNTSDSKRFEQDEKILTRLLKDLKKLKK